MSMTAVAVSGKGNCGHGCGKGHVARSALRVVARCLRLSCNLRRGSTY